MHISADYARKSPFGEPVVFGILGLLKAMGGVEGRDPDDLRGVTVDFQNPLFVGVDYHLGVKTSVGDQVKVAITDSGRLMLTATLRYREHGSGRPPGRTEGLASRAEASRLEVRDLVEGREVAGRYAPHPDRFRDLLARCGLVAGGNAASPVAALLWASYLVGMELPGERAVFSRLKIQCPEPPIGATGPIEYVARVAGFDERFDLLEVSASLAHAGVPFAEVEISALVRADSPTLRLGRIAALLPPSGTLRGRAALVVGGSRGLGAALVAALASQGCDVWLNYRSSRDEAEALIRSLPGEWGAARPAPGDATDEAWCRAWKAEIEAGGGLDLLVCNAVPAIRPLRFGLDTIGRLRQFVDDSLALVATPLASFGPLIEARGGWYVVISSSYASDSCAALPADLHHYVAAKRAAEGLAHSLASTSARSKFLVARPPRLLTDQTNTSSARHDASAVEDVAAAIVARLLCPSGEKEFAVLEDFHPPTPIEPPGNR